MSGPSLRDRLRGMNQRSLFGPGSRGMLSAPGGGPEAAEEDRSSARQARVEALQRLQVGLVGIAAMVLLVGLASIIGGQADLADELAVPEAAPTTEPSPTPTRANPLADAGVVPDIEAEPPAPPTPRGSPSAEAAGSGNGAAAR